MFRNAVRPLSRALARDSPTRHFHHIATEFIALDATGRPVSEKVPVVIGNPGQAYVLISPSVGEAFRDASSTASTRDRCKLTFFHDTKHFGLSETLLSIEVGHILTSNVFHSSAIELSSSPCPGPISPSV